MHSRTPSDPVDHAGSISRAESVRSMASAAGAPAGAAKPDSRRVAASAGGPAAVEAGGAGRLRPRPPSAGPQTGLPAGARAPPKCSRQAIEGEAWGCQGHAASASGLGGPVWRGRRFRLWPDAAAPVWLRRIGTSCVGWRRACSLLGRSRQVSWCLARPRLNPLAQPFLSPGASGSVDGAYLLTPQNYRSHVNRQAVSIRFLAGAATQQVPAPLKSPASGCSADARKISSRSS